MVPKEEKGRKIFILEVKMLLECESEITYSITGLYNQLVSYIYNSTPQVGRFSQHFQFGMGNSTYANKRKVQ